MISFIFYCGPMLVTVPKVVWLLITELVAILLMTTTFTFNWLLCQVLLCHQSLWKINKRGWLNSASSYSDGQVIRVARLSSNSKNEEPPLLINNKYGFFFSLKHICETINNKETIFASQAKRRKNIESGWVTMMCGYYDTNVSEVLDFQWL